MCGYDMGSPEANDPNQIIEARQQLQSSVMTYAPALRVTTWDKLRPWFGVALGFLFFVLWLHSCSMARF